MELSVLKKPKLVVALDVGTTYSGYAWQWRKDFENNRSNVEFNTNWGTGALQLHKTNTCLLLNKKGLVDSIGYLAEKRFTNICDEGGDAVDNWYFFKGFKHLLYQKGFNENMRVDDLKGRHLRFVDVMTQFICGLKNHFIKMLESRNFTITGSGGAGIREDAKKSSSGKVVATSGTQELDMGSVLWVVTVPAIWNEVAKKFMRTAAEKSGICRKNLLMSLESESAALYAMNLDREQRHLMNNLGEIGDKFVVADLGGGTVDISAVEVLHNGMLREICAGDGAMFGGQNINDSFFQVCTDVFEGPVWRETFSANNMGELLELETDFEKKKVEIGSSNEVDEFIKLKLPEHLTSMLREGKLTFKQTVKSGQIKADEVFQQKGAAFMFKSKFVRKVLFDETVRQTVAHVEKILTKAPGVRSLVLVGGFAESEIVIEKFNHMVQQKFPSVKVVVPTSPFRAVLHGAVLYGHDPLIFHSRVSRATIGVATNKVFITGEHDSTKMWECTENGKLYCKDIFHVHVKKGESVILNKPLETQTYNLMYSDQTDATVRIFATTNDEVPKYTTDPGCQLLTTVEVETPDTTGGTERKIPVSIIYGGSELSVIAQDETTGKEFNTKYIFDAV